jgi:hypothetical protein
MWSLDMQSPDRGFFIALTGLSLGWNASDMETSGFKEPLPALISTAHPMTLLPQVLFDPIANYFGATLLSGSTYKVFCDLNVAGEFLWFQFGGPNGALIYVPLDEMIIPIPASWKSSLEKDICLFGLAPAEGHAESNGTLVLGETFLRSAYVVFDLDHMKINLANAKWNVTDSHIVELDGDRGECHSDRCGRRSCASWI